MKRIIWILFLIVVVSLMLMLTGCGGENSETTEPSAESTTEVPESTQDSASSMDDLLADATRTTADDINNNSMDNIARAKQLYCNKTLLLESRVYVISEDHIVIGPVNYGVSENSYLVNVYLPIDEIVELDNWQIVTVVGITTDEITRSSEPALEMELNHYNMTVAYLVSVEDE